MELGDLPSDNKIRDAEKKLENILSSEDARPTFADWKKQVKFEKMGNAIFFSKIIPPLAKAETSLDILSLKPSLWLDASEQKQKAVDWMDKSGNRNHGKKHGSPKLQPHQSSGLQTLKYTSKSNDYHEFKEIKDIRTVFWVMSMIRQFGSPLCHQSTHHFYSNGNQFCTPSIPM